MADCPLCDEVHPRGHRSCPGRRVGTVVAGKYRIETVIGAGGIGAVYGATHLALHRAVALKMLQPQYVNDEELGRRFVREARQAAAIDHPGIVAVHDAGTDDKGGCYLEMEHLEGKTLYELVALEHPLDPLRVASLGVHTLDALAVIHDHGVVHRDMKSLNVFVVGEPGEERIKILDFGFAKADDGYDLTQSGQVLGTLLYMSPEQLLDPRSVDGRADLFAVAIMLYEALTGERPVQYSDNAELRKKVLQGELEQHPRQLRAEVPEWLDAIVAKAMNQDRDERFDDATAMKNALEQGLEHEQTPKSTGWLHRLLGRS